jgi:hypothetical protein
MIKEDKVTEYTSFEMLEYSLRTFEKDDEF